MLTAEFKYAIQQNQIGNNTHKVLVNLNAYGSKYTVDDIAIRVNNNLDQLQQATTISLGISGSTEFMHIPVNSTSYPVRVVDGQLLDVTDTDGVYEGSYYLYSIVTKNQRLVVSNPADIYYTDVLIEPAYGADHKILQDYSALEGNVLTSRGSEFIVESDRSYRTLNSSTNPVNLYSIINDIATPAKVQDSNYSNTGWTNARYKGSKITTTTNHNTEPFLQGTFFEGAFFGKDVKDTYIGSATATDVQYSQYFFSGKLDTLQYTIQDLKLSVYTTGSNSLTITSSLSSPPTPTLQVGDIFKILETTGNISTFSDEIYQMIAPTGSQQYYPYISQGAVGSDYLWYMQIKHNYSNTNTTPWRANTNLYRIVPTRIYSIKGTTIQPINEGKLRLKGTDTIVYTNKDGYVLSGSTTNII